MCNTLQHTATHHNTHTATHHTTSQHTATYCNTLEHTATHCNTLQHTVTHCNTGLLTHVQGRRLKRSNVHVLAKLDCNTLLLCATHCNTLTATHQADGSSTAATCTCLHSSTAQELTTSRGNRACGSSGSCSTLGLAPPCCPCLCSPPRLQCAAVCCIVWYCVAVCCSVLQCVAVCCKCVDSIPCVRSHCRTTHRYSHTLHHTLQHTLHHTHCNTCCAA